MAGLPFPPDCPNTTYDTSLKQQNRRLRCVSKDYVCSYGTVFPGLSHNCTEP